jgi:hypothetical protein
LIKTNTNKEKYRKKQKTKSFPSQLFLTDYTARRRGEARKNCLTQQVISKEKSSQATEKMLF